VREICTPGSVRGVARKGRPYRNWEPREGNLPGPPDNRAGDRGPNARSASYPGSPGFGKLRCIVSWEDAR